MGDIILRNELPMRKMNNVNEPRLYTITIMIDTSLDDEELEDRVRTFFNTIPSNDGSFNIMYANMKVIKKNRRLADIG